MENKILIYSPVSPKAAASESATAEKMSRPPKVPDNELLLSEERELGQNDIPADVLLSCRKLKYLSELYFSNKDNISDSAMKGAKRYACELAEELGGAAVFITSGKTEEIVVKGKRFSVSPLGRHTKLFELACWFSPNKDILESAPSLVELLDKYMPYALPERYGYSEPPEFEYEKSGKQHFIDFLRSEPTPVIYTRFPTVQLIISDAGRRPSEVDGYRASCIKLIFSSELWNYDEWQFALTRLLLKLTELFDGFFGQIVGHDDIGVAAWWWQGIPKEAGEVAVIGKPYISLIDDCTGSKNISQLPEFALFKQPDMPVIDRELISSPKKQASFEIPHRDRFIPAKNNPLIK